MSNYIKAADFGSSRHTRMVSNYLRQQRISFRSSSQRTLRLPFPHIQSVNHPELSNNFFSLKPSRVKIIPASRLSSSVQRVGISRFYNTNREKWNSALSSQFRAALSGANLLTQENLDDLADIEVNPYQLTQALVALSKAGLLNQKTLDFLISNEKDGSAIISRTLKAMFDAEILDEERLKKLMDDDSDYKDKMYYLCQGIIILDRAECLCNKGFDFLWLNESTGGEVCKALRAMEEANLLTEENLTDLLEEGDNDDDRIHALCNGITILHQEKKLNKLTFTFHISNEFDSGYPVLCNAYQSMLDAKILTDENLEKLMKNDIFDHDNREEYMSDNEYREIPVRQICGVINWLNKVGALSQNYVDFLCSNPDQTEVIFNALDVMERAHITNKENFSMFFDKVKPNSYFPPEVICKAIQILYLDGLLNDVTLEYYLKNEFINADAHDNLCSTYQAMHDSGILNSHNLNQLMKYKVEDAAEDVTLLFAICEAIGLVAYKKMLGDPEFSFICSSDQDVGELLNAFLAMDNSDILNRKNLDELLKIELFDHIGGKDRRKAIFYGVQILDAYHTLNQTTFDFVCFNETSERSLYNGFVAMHQILNMDNLQLLMNLNADVFYETFDAATILGSIVDFDQKFFDLLMLMGPNCLPFAENLRRLHENRNLYKEDLALLRDDRARWPLALSSAFVILSDAHIFTRATVKDVLNGGRYAISIAQGFVELQRSGVLTREYRQIVVNSGGWGHQVGRGIALLSQYRILNPENQEAILRVPQYAHRIAQALGFANREGMLSPENREAIVQSGPYAREVISGLFYLHRKHITLSGEERWAFLQTGIAAPIVSQGIGRLGEANLLENGYIRAVINSNDNAIRMAQRIITLSRLGVMTPFILEALASGRRDAYQVTFPISALRVQAEPLNVLQAWADLPRKLIEIQYIGADNIRMEGIDAGGLSKDFYTKLIGAFVTSCSSDHEILRFLQTLNGTQLSQIGSLFSYIYALKFVMGRIFPDSFFEMLRIVNDANSAQDPEKQRAIIHMLNLPHLETFHSWIEGNDESQDEAIELLQTYEIDEVIFHEEEKEEWKKRGQEIIDLTTAPYFRVLASIREGLFGVLKSDLENGEISTAAISRALQGQPLTGEKFIRALRLNTDNRVVIQKLEWLKERILQEEENGSDWNLRLFFSITAQKALKENQVIKIARAYNNCCISHSCFSQLDISPYNTTKEEFYLQLDRLASCEDFGLS